MLQKLSFLIIFLRNARIAANKLENAHTISVCAADEDVRHAPASAAGNGASTMTAC
jgi:hypothetical protein